MQVHRHGFFLHLPFTKSYLAFSVRPLCLYGFRARLFENTSHELKISNGVKDGQSFQKLASVFLGSKFFLSPLSNNVV
jgi:hypothetical protein